MARDMDKKGDFGLPRRRFECDQVVGIYDLVGFTELPSNKDLVQAVSMLETELELKLSNNYYWGEIDPQGDDNSSGKTCPTVVNDVLLRSTGDGYVRGPRFSQYVRYPAGLLDAHPSRVDGDGKCTNASTPSTICAWRAARCSTCTSHPGVTRRPDTSLWRQSVKGSTSDSHAGDSSRVNRWSESTDLGASALPSLPFANGAACRVTLARRAAAS